MNTILLKTGNLYKYRMFDMVEGKHITHLLIYLNDADGDTVLLEDDKETEKTRITPEQYKKLNRRQQKLYTSDDGMKSYIKKSEE